MELDLTDVFGEEEYWDAIDEGYYMMGDVMESKEQANFKRMRRKKNKILKPMG
jgi:hypothetical protein